jgi:DNA topoisomerase-1
LEHVRGGKVRLYEARISKLRRRKAAERVAAKYKSKKKIKNQDGKEFVVYEYSKQQMEHRDREKAKRIQNLRENLGKLRIEYKKDLTSKDEKTRLTALAVALIDLTYERVGNAGSAKDGHFGVTGWQKKHVTLGKGKATFKYVGKSGVKQEKVVTDSKVVSVLRDILKGKDSPEAVLCEGDGCKANAGAVNAYLKDHGVTAKDIRGMHANEEMITELKRVRGKGSKLPADRKDREKVLKAELKEALEIASKAVGHEASTLKGQYLVPGLVDGFLHDGSIMSRLDKKGSAIGQCYPWATKFAWDKMGAEIVHGTIFDEMTGRRLGHAWVEWNGKVYDWQTIEHYKTAPMRIPAWRQTWEAREDYRLTDEEAAICGIRAGVHGPWTEAERATVMNRNASASVVCQAVQVAMFRRFGKKTPAEKEDEEADRLVKPSPKKKPPRRDRERRQVDIDGDDPDEKADKKDKSNRDRKADSHLVALRWILSRATSEDMVSVRSKKTKKIVQVNKDWKKGQNAGDYEEIEPTDDDAPAQDGEAAPAEDGAETPSDEAPAETEGDTPAEDAPAEAEKKSPFPEPPTDLADLNDPGKLEAFRADIMKQYKALGLTDEQVTDVTDQLTGGKTEEGKARDLDSEDLDDAKTLLDETVAKVEEEKAAEEKRKLEEKAKKDRVKAKKKNISQSVDSLSGSGLRDTRAALKEMDDEAYERFEAALTKERDRLAGSGVNNVEKFVKNVAKIQDVLDDAWGSAGDKLRKDAEKLAEALAQVEYYDKVVDNPTEDVDNPIPKSSPSDAKPPTKAELKKSQEAALARGAAAVKKYQKLSKEERARHHVKISKEIESDPGVKKLTSEIKKMERKGDEATAEEKKDLKKKRAALIELKRTDPRLMHLASKQRGIGIAAALEEGGKAKGIGGAMSRLIKAAETTGNLEAILGLGQLGGEDHPGDDDQALIRKIYSDIAGTDWIDVLPEGHPALPLAELLADPEKGRFLDEQDKEDIRQQLTDMALAEYSYFDTATMKSLGPDATVDDHDKAAKKLRAQSGEEAGAPPDQILSGGIEKVKSWFASVIEAMAAAGKKLKITDSPARRDKKKKDDEGSEAEEKEAPEPKKVKMEDRKPGDVWQDSRGNWWAKDPTPEGNVSDFKSEEYAKAFANGETGEFYKNATLQGWDFTPWQNINHPLNTTQPPDFL